MKQENWTSSETTQLMNALSTVDISWINWTRVANQVPTRTKKQCVVHYHQTIKRREKGKSINIAPETATQLIVSKDIYHEDTSFGIFMSFNEE
ncbi:Myb-like DNA-binding domain-containing protein [Spironucleus salmonicida]|uniref:Myb-like DNA-binding domain-containing protein n=1 Tax=Spironucleus salmonicida TaxID=348837 RepID=V6LK41_9EUKA|nr:Myb-like DNA-binding domain-containing protein [Spironucleus salmonicida]|eukprot:EST44990.1 Myb-like DNA-binding domain-containing protein [Spironucleus salmonicida]